MHRNHQFFKGSWIIGIVLPFGMMEISAISAEPVKIVEISPTETAASVESVDSAKEDGSAKVGIPVKDGTSTKEEGSVKDGTSTKEDVSAKEGVSAKEEDSAEESASDEPLISVEVTDLSAENPVPLRILPREITESEQERFHASISRSRTPGFVLESPHFQVETDAKWGRNTQELVQIVQKLESVLHEAELTASLWRKPLPHSVGDSAAGNSASGVSDVGVSASSKVALSASSSGQKMRLCVVTPGTEAASKSTFHRSYTRTAPEMRSYSDATLQRAAQYAKYNQIYVQESTVVGNSQTSEEPAGPCRFEVFDEGPVFTLEIASSRDFETKDFQSEIRREAFRTILYDGQESVTFPVWLQEGLLDAFAGEIPLTIQNTQIAQFSQNTIPLSRLQSLTEGGSTDSHFRDASRLWLAYFLTGNQSRQFFPFFTQLNQIHERGLKALETQNFEEVQRSATFALETFVRHGEQNLQNPWIPMAEWAKTPDVQKPRVLWQSAAIDLRWDFVDENSAKTFDLPAEWKNVLQEMALILEMANEFQNRRWEAGVTSFPSNYSQTTLPDGMKIVEFSAPKTFGEPKRTENTPFKTVPEGSETVPEGSKPAQEGSETAADASETAKNEDETEVTPEDIQKLEDVFQWASNSSNSVQYWTSDGSLLSSCWDSNRILQLFHPAGRAYLLQEYNGSNLLSATFSDGSVLHVRWDPSSEGKRPAVWILGGESPEKKE